jgi:predicted cupin superfamily sugar epimerase
MAADQPSDREPPSPTLTAAEVISLLDLKTHPEGGYFRETFRDERTLENGRAASTAIYFLLSAGRCSHWHRVDAAEAWHHYGGAALRLAIFDGETTREVRLGSDILNGEQPQAGVPAGAWQAAQTFGDWTLVGCTVAPAFEFDRFEIAPKDWSPGA